MKVSFKNGFYWSFRIGKTDVCFRGTDCRINCGEWLEKTTGRNTIDLYFNPVAWLPDGVYYRLCDCVKALRMIAHGEKIKRAFRIAWDNDSYFWDWDF